MQRARIRAAGVATVALLVAGTVAAPRVFAVDATAQIGGSDAATVAPLHDSLFDDELDTELEKQPAGFPDPFERVNRGTLDFNRHVDRWVLDPITQVYRFLVPDPARRAVRRLLANLNSPAVLVNDLLQREWKDGGVTVTRFALNTTLGCAGIFDPASNFGYAAHRADFGQTLALEGVKSGPFIMLPVFGPTTMRDGVGYLVDILFRPTTYILGPADQLVFTTVHGSSAGLATRDENAQALEALEESSVDYYAALRNAYYQHRHAQIWARHDRHEAEEVAAVAHAGAAESIVAREDVAPGQKDVAARADASGREHMASPDDAATRAAAVACEGRQAKRDAGAPAL
jgi:phospholipid-binding lipoprotein MlaA